MATSRDYNRAVEGKNTETTSFRVKDRDQIHHALKQAGLSPRDYIFSPLSQNSSPKAATSSHTSAFSNYPLHQKRHSEQPLKSQSQYLYTSGRPISYVQQPPPPPPAAQPPYNQLQGPHPPPSQGQGGSSALSNLFGSASNTQNTTSQPPPGQAQGGSSGLSNLFGSAANTQNTTSQPPPGQAQGGSSGLSNLFGSAANTQNTTSQPPPGQAQGGSSALSNLFGSAANTQNTSSQPPPNMSQHISSPYRSPPPPPHSGSDPHDSSFSAQHYLRQINCQDNPPVRVVKPSTQNVVYRKEIRIRYLQPPTPPPPAPIIIREKHIPSRPPQSPLLIRERKPDARTPPPLTIRERPPTPPAPLEPYVIEKNLPPPPPQPRQIIIERLPTPPPKPRTVIFEKWLPYKKVKRPVMLQRAPPREPIKQTRNVVIEYEPLKVFTVRRVIEEGVFRVDPHQFSSYNAQSQSGGGNIRIVERIEDLPPPSEQLARVLSEYKLPVQPCSTHLSSYDHYPHQGFSEHIPSNIQHLLTGPRPASHIDQLTNVSRASNTPAYRQDRVSSPGYNSSSASPVIVPIQRSYSASSNHSSKHLSFHDNNPIRSDINDIY